MDSNDSFGATVEEHCIFVGSCLFWESLNSSTEVSMISVRRGHGRQK